MKYLLTLVCLLFCLGCGPPDVSNDPRLLFIDSQLAQLDGMYRALDSDAQTLAADANNLYEVRLPAFLSSLDSNQIIAFDEFVLSAQCDNPITTERAFRGLRQCLSIDQRIDALQLFDGICDIHDRKTALLLQYQACERKRKEILNYGHSFLLESARTQAELDRQAYNLNQGLQRTMLWEFQLQRTNRPVIIEPPSNYWQEQRAQQEFLQNLYR